MNRVENKNKEVMVENIFGLLCWTVELGRECVGF